MLGDVRAVVGVAERSRQCVNQAAHRSAEHDRVAVQEHEARVGIHRGQRFEGERVMRALQRPPAADPAALEHLQREAVVLVGRALVDASSHRPYVGTLEIASHDRLLKSWLITAMHSVGPSGSSWWMASQPGVELLEHVAAHPRRFDPRTAAKIARRRWRHAVARLPAQEGAVAVVLFEEVAEERRAGTEHADDDERCIDAFR